MSETLKMINELGITQGDLKSALFLARDLRAKAHQQGLNPRATSIAILYLEKVDRHVSAKHLTIKEMRQLEDVASILYEETMQKLLQ